MAPLNATNWHRISGLGVCRAFVSPVHRIPSISGKFIGDLNEPRRFFLNNKYAFIRDPDYDATQYPFWFCVFTPGMKDPKCVRSWARRKMMKAVMWELRNRGFDLKGKRVNPGGLLPREETRRCLAGMCELHLEVPIKTADSAAMQKSVKKLVDAIMLHCHTTRRIRSSKIPSTLATKLEKDPDEKRKASRQGQRPQGKVSTKPQKAAVRHDNLG